MKKFAVIVAAGSGSRMGNTDPKQFLSIAGKPLVRYSVEAFASVYDDIRIILVAHPDHIERSSQTIKGFKATIVPGGSTRFASVKAGLEHVEPNSIVFVHDAARCLITPQLVKNCFIAACDKGNAVPAVAPADSIRIISAEGSQSIDRGTVRLVQTPQTFHASVLRDAYTRVAGDQFTDDAAVVESCGTRINLIEGDPTNIKVTYPADLLLAEMILRQRTAAS